MPSPKDGTRRERHLNPESAKRFGTDAEWIGLQQPGSSPGVQGWNSRGFQAKARAAEEIVKQKACERTKRLGLRKGALTRERENLFLPRQEAVPKTFRRVPMLLRALFVLFVGSSSILNASLPGQFCHICKTDPNDRQSYCADPSNWGDYSGGRRQCRDDNGRCRLSGPGCFSPGPGTPYQTASQEARTAARYLLRSAHKRWGVRDHSR